MHSTSQLVIAPVEGLKGGNTLSATLFHRDRDWYSSR